MFVKLLQISSLFLLLLLLSFSVPTEAPPGADGAPSLREQELRMWICSSKKQISAIWSKITQTSKTQTHTHTLMRGRGQRRTCQSGKSVRERRSARTKNSFTSRSFRGESNAENWKLYELNTTRKTQQTRPDHNLTFYIGLAAELKMKTWHRWCSTK